MLKKLTEFFRRDPDPAKNRTSIDAPLAAAALMLEVTWADHETDRTEIERSTALLEQLFNLDASVAGQLVDDARDRLQHNVGVQTYTRHLNEALSEADKFDVITALWRVAQASNGVDRFEEHTIRRIADLLYLSHDRFIQAKLLARQNPSNPS